MSLSLSDRDLLVKLFYQNDNSAVVPLWKFQTLKGIWKGSLTVKKLLIIIKFQKVGFFNVRLGKGRKLVSIEEI